MRLFLTLFLLSILMTLSCNDSSSFYKHTSREDLYRIPLIKPYELVNIAVGKEDSSSQAVFYHWSFKKDEEDEDVYIGGDIFYAGGTQINVKKGIIFGYSDAPNYPPANYFIFIPNQKSGLFFKEDRSTWETLLRQNGIDTIKTYDAWKVYRSFVKTGTVPWYVRKRSITPYE